MSPSFSILVETENLAAVEDNALDRCLRSLAAQDLPPARANEVLVLDSGEAPAEVLDGLRGRYPWVDVVGIGDCDYYEAKLRGAEMATGDVLVLCDSDCSYPPGWLGGLIEAFEFSEGIEIVTGETTTEANGPYGVAMALSYLFPRPSGDAGLQPESSYDTNNTAIRRDLLLRHPFPTGLPMYRGNHVIQARELLREGHAIWRQPKSTATHPVPEGASYFFWRFLLLGDEALTIARFSRPPESREVRPVRDAALCAAIAGGRVKQLLARTRPVISEDRRRLRLRPWPRRSPRQPRFCTGPACSPATCARASSFAGSSERMPARKLRRCPWWCRCTAPGPPWCAAWSSSRQPPTTASST